MADIFEEADEAIKQEKLEKIWKEYGPTIIGCAVLVVLATAGLTGFNSWNTHRNGQETARILQALDAQDPANALLKIVDDAGPGHRAVALLSAASSALQDENYEQALHIYERAIDAPGLEKDFRDLARVMAARLSMMVPEQKKGEALITILQPVLDNEKSPWLWHARLEAATISAHYLGNYTKAQNYLSGFKDAVGLPDSLQTRAKALSHVYRLKSLPETQEPQG